MHCTIFNNFFVAECLFVRPKASGCAWSLHMRSWKEQSNLYAKRVRYPLCRKSTIRHGSDASSFGIYGRGNAYSYEVTYRIAKYKKPHTIAKELIKPCAEKMVEIMIESGAKMKIHQVSLSNETIRQRIHDMVVNGCQQVCPKSSKARSRLAFNWTRLPIAL